ncbi:MAG: site-specific DNA-methyltransferase [Alphaproteobacteria bacterium]|nr:site-specific DNA-methyltransferase [Alphaproteobacteria bacterium]
MKFLSELQNDGTPSPTFWTHSDAGHNGDARAEIKEFNAENPFATPKPERLLKRILEIATNPGDLVLDSFAGSGTTGAVAHKMRRRWIMIELLDTAYSHIHPRLKQVVDGSDQGGISKAVEWSGGGGFRFYELAPSLIKKDKYDQWVISDQYNPEMLAESICKHMGFTYAPTDEYWNHGYSSERDFIFVTTQTMHYEDLQYLSETIGDSRSLLVCCGAFLARPNQFANLTLKKIPKVILDNCDWSHDDYSLKTENLPLRSPKTLLEGMER